MVLDSTNVAYRYPTPSTPSPRKEHNPVKLNGSPRRAPATPISQQHHASNGKAYSRNATLAVQSNGILVPQRIVMTPAVIIPAMPPMVKRDEYQKFPHIDSRISDDEKRAKALSKKRKRERTEGMNVKAVISADSREKSDVALRSLQDLVGNIFEAEDQLQPDTSGAISAATADCFVSGSYGDTESPTLAPIIQVRLEVAIRKVISLNRFDDLPVDHLLRLEKLCEGALKSAENVNLNIEGVSSDDDIEDWIRKLETAEVGLRATQTVLRIMTSGRHEKQLSSEELLQTMLNVVNNVLDSCIVPVVECRSSGSGSDLFKTMLAQKKAIAGLLHQTRKALALLAELLVREEVTEGAITTVEFLTSRLLFVENAHAEKDSVLGIQKFETLRRTAMDVLAMVFSKYPDQRTFIFDEILTSLEKLPVTRQSARQFKLIEGGSIQLVSALIMQLVQTSGISSDEISVRKSKRPVESFQDDPELSGEDASIDQKSKSEQGSDMNDTELRAVQDPGAAMQQLDDLIQPLHDSAHRNAQYVIKFLVQRALTSTKTGDQPYQNLLYIFTEDFITVLGSIDWPAAELLLRVLLGSMLNIAEGERSAAPAKNMALDLMGLMGSGISDLLASARQSSKGLEKVDSELSNYLALLSEGYLEGTLQESELLEWKGPYRVTLELLLQRGLDDPQFHSASGYLISQWAKSTCTYFETLNKDSQDERVMTEYGQVAYRLRRMILDRKWLENQDLYESVSVIQGHLAYAVAVLRMPFCKAFDHILRILLSSMSSDQATVRSRALKSVIQLLDKDPSILERGAYVMNHILKCSSDASSLVRDSAVALMAKCILLKPALEDQIYKAVLSRTADAAVGVRKRSMKLSKDIYLRNTTKDIKAAIADSLLQRITDVEESVSDLAKQMFEEIWIAPYYRLTEDPEKSVQFKLAIREQAGLIIKTVQRGDAVSSVLDILLQKVLSNESKTAAGNFRVCKTMVAAMVDGIVDTEELPDKPPQQCILQALTVFAKASAKLFTVEQLEFLQPYINNLQKTDDLVVYRSVIVIYRCVLPHLSNLRTGFLQNVQSSLFATVSRLGKSELNEVVSCLSTINLVLKNIDRLARLTISCLQGAYKVKDADLSSDVHCPTKSKVIKWMIIAAMFGKYCDFESDQKLFLDQFPWWKGNSVSGLMINIVTPFTSPKQPLEIRRTALDSIGMICQSWPKHFLNEQVNSAFDIVFTERNPDLQNVVLSGFKDFFGLEEKRSETAEGVLSGEDPDTESGRLAGASKANENDGISTAIAQRFVTSIIEIALATQDNYALIATEILASINRQGLVHPKECGPALVALETSSNTLIAEIAFCEHRNQHQKHETMFEKEYMKAVHQAFIYQRDVVGNSLGATVRPFVSKLRSLFEVIKSSNGKYRKKFLTQLCTKIDFDPAKLDVTVDPPPHLLFAKFVLENMAFFEYGRTDELLHVITTMEKLVAGTGTGVAHSIETVIFGVQLGDTKDGTLQAPTHPPLTEYSVIPERLRQLTASSMILSMLWETRTFLRRQYGLLTTQKQRDTKTNKGAAKDLSKPPVKSQGVTGDKYWDEISRIASSLSSPEAMMNQCKEFNDLLSVDQELKLAAEGDEEAAAPATTPSEDEEAGSLVPLSGGGRGRKRSRNSVGESQGQQKKKKRQPSAGKGKRGSADVDVDGDWE
ncbi:MAG: Sister chromatid cohesion protein 2 [Pycnora praestabilis]|nr:MAG: Sister chromatid cohesion protein 2 [Pycnora praestabilis]